MFYVGDILWLEENESISKISKDFTGPIRDFEGGFWWFKNGLLHRDPDPETGLTGPARIWVDKTQIWFKNGLKHREDGPTYIYENNYAGSWWFKGLYYGEGPNKPKDFPV